jgi:integrase/recombinase XerD
MKCLLQTLEKSVISYWINERGFKLEDVQIMAGHKYPSSTQKYIRVNTEKQREVMTRLHGNIFE